ncbi:hypothetical protein HY478_03420 [Candidatus Uhrbacteria bacterium]|nr:hypothetical protein [Candidatus Uhrbacteria bacterium]
MRRSLRHCLIVFGLVAIAVLSRLLPHPANFTAMGAVALFSGTYLPRRWGIFVSLAIMLVTDAVLGFYEPLVMLGVYGSFALAGLVGWYIRTNKKPSTVFLGALSASILFFIVTNFAVWAFTPLYPKTPMGLSNAYALAVPFFRNMLLGDLIYTAVLYGVFELGATFVRARQGSWQAAL